MFDHTGCLKRYSGAVEILKEFFDVRLDLYRKRKEYLEGQLTAEAAKLTNQARFIVEKIEGKVVVGELRSSVLHTRVHAHACMHGTMLVIQRLVGLLYCKTSHLGQTNSVHGCINIHVHV